MLIAIKPVVVVLGGQPSPKFSFGWSPGGVGLHPHERIENEDLTLGKLMQKGAEKKKKKTWLPLEHDMQTLAFPHRPVSLQSGIALEKIIKAGSPSPHRLLGGVRNDLRIIGEVGGLKPPWSASGNGEVSDTNSGFTQRILNQKCWIYQQQIGVFFPTHILILRIDMDMCFLPRRNGGGLMWT